MQINEFEQKDDRSWFSKASYEKIMLIILSTIAVIGLSVRFLPYDKMFKFLTLPEKEKPITKYVHGAVLDKILDVRYDRRSLVYRNQEGNIFIIRESELWNKAEIGDSILVGYQENVFLIFTSIKVLGKARSKKNYSTLSSPATPSTPVVIVR